MNKEAYMFSYNGEKHGLRRRINQKDYTRRMQEFFDHFLKGRARARVDGERAFRICRKEKEKEKYRVTDGTPLSFRNPTVREGAAFSSQPGVLMIDLNDHQSRTPDKQKGGPRDRLSSPGGAHPPGLDRRDPLSHLRVAASKLQLLR
jgi:hypothetical protein